MGLLWPTSTKLSSSEDAKEDGSLELSDGWSRGGGRGGTSIMLDSGVHFKIESELREDRPGT